MSARCGLSFNNAIKYNSEMSLTLHKVKWVEHIAENFKGRDHLGDLGIDGRISY
jgi:hypothetical protein